MWVNIQCKSWVRFECNSTDHVLNRQLLLALLNKVNVEVHIASNGEEVLDLLMQSGQLFDLILMDIQMPVIDGFIYWRGEELPRTDIQLLSDDGQALAWEDSLHGLAAWVNAQSWQKDVMQAVCSS